MFWSRDIDGIVWTLEIEMKFYLICAMLIVPLRQQSLKVFLAPIVIFILAIFINNHITDWGKSNASLWQLAVTFMTISQYIICMFIGVVFHYLQRARIEIDKAYLLVGILFTLFCIHWYLGPASAQMHVAWSYAFALLTFILAFTYQNSFKSNKLFDFLADISYPLYVIHGVAGYVALRILIDLGFKAWLSLLIVTGCCIFLSWLLHVSVEKPSQLLGKKLAGKFLACPGGCKFKDEQVAAKI